MNHKTAHDLWRDFHFLTREMLKFLDKQDMEIFNELMKQRDRLQTLIDESPDEGFKASSLGQSLLSEIYRDDQELIRNFQQLFNRSKRLKQASDVYSGVNTGSFSRRNWQR